MKPLPVMNECLPRCGECCGGSTPVYASEVGAILTYLRSNAKKAEKQLRAWNGDRRWCPFLMPDKRCFVYPVRPSVCSAFGHIPELRCPHEAEGRVRFAAWPAEEVAAHEARHPVDDPHTRAAPLSAVGAALARDGLAQPLAVRFSTTFDGQFKDAAEASRRVSP